MSINLSIPKPEQEQELKPRLTVMGVGGAGGNAVNNMIASELEGVEFVVANTDAQALGHSSSETTIQLGAGGLTRTGCGFPGLKSAVLLLKKSLDEIMGHSAARICCSWLPVWAAAPERVRHQLLRKRHESTAS
jgi:cell division protein FtsZ